MISSGTMKRKAKELTRAVLPLSVRKGLSISMSRWKWIAPFAQDWWTQELLRDYAISNSSEYHRFLWANHLAYAATYNINGRFGEGNMKESRRMFFSEMRNLLHTLRIDPAKQVNSVFEVGCSLGYQLRYLETDVFTQAIELVGIDIDRQAIDQGSQYLRTIGSKVRLRCADMGDLHAILQGKLYDVIVCTGVLMYIDEKEACEVVHQMLQHCRILLSLSGLAHPEQDNRTLAHSTLREMDSSFVHNFDSMLQAAGGAIIARRWEGARTVDGHTIYFIFAQQQGGYEKLP
jgi:2-polyprenyl-3-methyl-5-hydroxy-6-metoxy-1,4-benzoquinol methylase